MVLQPHQLRTVDKLDKNPGLIAYHGLGSGKTLTSLVAAQRAIKANQASGRHDKALFVVPASLQDNIWKEVAKHRLEIPKDQMRVLTYEKAVRELPELQKQHFSIGVFDEAHKLRNQDTERYKAMRQLAANADRRLLLTGSLSYNQPADLAPLVNMAAGTKVMPSSPEEFNAQYTREVTHNPSILKRLMGHRSYKATEMHNADKLVEKIRPYIDRHNSKSVDPKSFPSVTHHNVDVEMDSKQNRLYNYMAGKMPKLLAYKIKHGLPLSKQESKNLNAFSGAVRQISDSVVPYDPSAVSSPKLDTTVRHLRDRMKADPNFKAVVYSNFLEAGLSPMAKQLKHFGIPAHEFTGSVTRKNKNAMVEDFNSLSPKARVMLLSSSGGEGLDLKGVRLHQIIEPHFNLGKIEQSVGRSVRYRSHAHLPEADRHVDVEHYRSVKPRTLMQRLFRKDRDQAIDEYLTEMSRRKDMEIGKIRDGLEQEST